MRGRARRGVDRRAACRPAARRARVSVLVAVTGLLLTMAPLARAASTRPVVAIGPVTVTVDAMSPVAATNGTTLTVRGTLRNTGSTPVDDLRLLLGTGSAPRSRATLLRDLGDPPGITRVLLSCSTCGPRRLAAGASGAYVLTVPLGTRLDTGVVAVYPLTVRVDGTGGSSVDGTGGETGGALGEASTFLPYLPAPVTAPLQVSWLVPLDPAPVQAADGTVAAAGFPASLGRAGALGGTLAAATGSGAAPVTYAVEPSLLAAAAQTARGSWSRTGSPSTPLPADAGSVAFLAQLSAQTRGRQVLALPYGDPDAVAVTHAGRGTDLSVALATGRQLVADALPAATVLAGTAWVPGAGVDPPTLDTYAAAGTTAVVLPGGQLPPRADAFPPTQSARTTLPTRSSTLTGLVLDPDVQALLAAGGRDAPTPRMAAQRLLALLALALGETPNSDLTRDVVLALPRGTTPDPAWLREVLSDTGSVRWLAAKPIGDLTADTGPAATGSGNRADTALGERDPLGVYPASDRAAELPAAVLGASGDGVGALQGRLDALAAALPDASLTRPLSRALQRSESYAWRADPAGGQALRAGVAARTSALAGSLRLSTAGTVTLASSQATIPVTVQNALPQPATVMLSLASADPTRLTSTATRVVVPAASSRRVLLPATTRRTGTFRASLTMTTPAGLALAVAPVTVHSRAYGTVSLAITFGALGVLLVAILARAVRRLRGRRATPAPGGAA